MRNLSIIFAGRIGIASAMLGVAESIDHLGEQKPIKFSKANYFFEREKEGWQGQGKRRKPKMK